MTKLLSPLAATYKRKVETWASPAYSGWSVEYLFHPGAVVQHLPGVGQEPSHVEIVGIYYRDWIVDFKFLKDMGLDYEGFEEELQQRILNSISQ